MTLDEIRERHEASPFKPFKLRLSSGRELAVEHPEFMLVPPAGGLIAVSDRKHHIHVVNIEHVEEIDHSPVKNENGRKRRK
jgi:hypothetical protein